MTSPLRLPPITPPPLPSFVQARPGTLPGTATTSGDRGFSLDLAHAHPAHSSQQSRGVLVERVADALTNQVNEVAAMQTQASSLARAHGTSVGRNQTELLSSAQKADLAFHLLMEIRNKLMDAYREVQQIQI